MNFPLTKLTDIFLLALKISLIVALPSCTKARPTQERKTVPEFLSYHSVPYPKFDDKEVGDEVIRRARAEITSTTDPATRLALVNELGHLLSTRERDLSAALAMFQEAKELAVRHDPVLADELLVNIGLIQLRIGELANCSANHNRDSCIYPLSALAQHKDKVGAAAALKQFNAYLERHPTDEQVLWLAALTRMALGDPAGEKWIKERGYNFGDAPFPRFTDLAATAGLHGTPTASGGVLVEDFNGDGYLDVVVSSAIPGDRLQYFLSDGREGFINKSDISGIGKIAGGLNMGVTDYNGDGRPDIYVSRRTVKLFRQVPAGYGVYNALLRNNGDGTFTDVTKEVGLLVAGPNKNVAAGWADYDGDGWLDLFVCNENRGPDLFHNDHGHFSLVTEKAGIKNVGTCGGVAWGDVNNDKYPDLFFTNLDAPNHLYINQKDGTFRESAQPALRSGPRMSYNTWFFDFDNDGWLDLFVAAFDFNVSHMLLSFQGKPYPGDHQRLFHNRGDGTFEDVTRQVGLDQSVKVMGGNFGDLDNDGYLDIFLGTGGHGFGDLVPQIVYHNEESRKFKAVSVSGGFSNLQKGHGVSFTDLDNDGQPDVVIALGGMYDSDRYFSQFLHNPGFPNHFLTLRLTGNTANTLAIGSRVKAEIRENGKTRFLYRTVGRGASFGSNSLQVQLGLGKATRVESLEVQWAGSATLPERFGPIRADAFYRIVQGSGKVERLHLRKLSFAGDKRAAHRHP